MKFLFLELWWFGLKQVRSCFFAGSFLALLVLLNYVSIPGLARYDFLFLGSVAIQVFMLVTKIETWDEFKVIVLFHAIGLALEIFKTQPQIGSWSYPEEGWIKVLGVPLYSGFMYAAVASYMTQAWTQLKLRLENYPPYWVSIPLVLLVYANFFTHHFLPDIRWWLIAGLFLAFFRTQVFFVVRKKEWHMSLFLSFILIGFFIWVAENISTFYGAWKYPDQLAGWRLVHLQKITSWFLFTIISFLLVADLKHFKEGLQDEAQQPDLKAL